MSRLRITTSESWKPEKEYAFHVILKEVLGVDYVIEYQHINGHRIDLGNGAVIMLTDSFNEAQLGESILYTTATDFFSKKRSTHLPAPDLFAATFFMLTRWEETISSIRDAHGRFPAEESYSWKNGLLHRPIVNEWADQLWTELVRKGLKCERKRRKFQILISCDVDHPLLWWSSLDKIRTLAGAILKRNDWNEAQYWLKVHLFQKKDPYDIFDEWLDLFEKNNLIAQFNFMGERPRSSDSWYSLGHPFVKNLMTKISVRGHNIGFHPSYEAFENQEIFNRELTSLQEVSPLPITAGRQHYLRFSAPKTWQMWENAGLLEDSTLGYPEAAGFRCGICHDFPVFDTEQRKMLQLREKPLIAMDVSLAHYRRYSPQKAAEHLSLLRREVERHGGDFTILWHNSSWNTLFWEEWKAVFLDFIAR